MTKLNHYFDIIRLQISDGDLNLPLYIFFLSKVGHIDIWQYFFPVASQTGYTYIPKHSKTIINSKMLI